jgi:hypothetical protein
MYQENFRIKEEQLFVNQVVITCSSEWSKKRVVKIRKGTN